MWKKAARPKNGRPLQKQYGFVEAGPSHAFRDGPGIFVVKLSYYLGLERLRLQGQFRPKK
jgi:hypothetical protein